MNLHGSFEKIQTHPYYRLYAKSSGDCLIAYTNMYIYIICVASSVIGKIQEYQRKHISKHVFSAGFRGWIPIDLRHGILYV